MGKSRLHFFSCAFLQLFFTQISIVLFAISLKIFLSSLGMMDLSPFCDRTYKYSFLAYDFAYMIFYAQGFLVVYFLFSQLYHYLPM